MGKNRKKGERKKFLQYIKGKTKRGKFKKEREEIKSGERKMEKKNFAIYKLSENRNKNNYPLFLRQKKRRGNGKIKIERGKGKKWGKKLRKKERKKFFAIYKLQQQLQK